MQEHQVEGGLEVLVVLTRFRHGKEREQGGEVVVLLGEPVAQERYEGGVEHPLGVLPERVSGLAVPVGVHDVAVDEGEDIGIGLHVLERVVVQGLIKVDGVEAL